MIETFLLAGLLLPSDTLVFSGRDHQLAVSPPRFEEAGIEIDGRMDEGNWDEAASLVGFTQYEPVEGLPSTENTEIRVLYTPEAIYFGIWAYDG